MGRQQTTFLLSVLLTTLSRVSPAQTDAQILLQAEDSATAFGWNGVLRYVQQTGEE